jgi:hypothetical protein
MLAHVMAISSGNSIYVATQLTCDPSDEPPEYALKHILGNIGEPGISFLIPPLSPLIRKEDEQTWQLVNHEQFNGNLDNSFKSTSLHLSFTRYKLPISVNEHGDQTIEAYFREALVSVIDRKAWIADLDILRGLQSPYLVRLGQIDDCVHQSQAVPPFYLSSIDSWNEYLDRPETAAIFRANTNWQARLAATVLNGQRSRPTILLREQKTLCWHCLQVQCQTYLNSNDANTDSSVVPMFVY